MKWTFPSLCLSIWIGLTVKYWTTDEPAGWAVAVNLLIAAFGTLSFWLCENAWKAPAERPQRSEDE